MLSGLTELDMLTITDKDKAQSESATVTLSVDIIMNQVRQQKKNIVFDKRDDDEDSIFGSWER